MSLFHMKTAVKKLILVTVTTTLVMVVAVVSWFASTSSDSINQTNNEAIYAEQRAVAVQQIGNNLLTIGRERARLMLFADVDSLVQGRALIEERTAKIKALFGTLSDSMNSRLAVSSADGRAGLMTEKKLIDDIQTPWQRYAASIEQGTLPRLDAAIESLRVNRNVAPVLQTALDALHRDIPVAQKVEHAVEAYSTHMQNESSRLAAAADEATAALRKQLILAAAGTALATGLISFGFSFDKFMSV